MSGLASLDAWYLSQCDGDWEHHYGVEITTTDNPGWSITIDLCDVEHRVTADISKLNLNSPDDTEAYCHFRFDSKVGKLNIYAAAGHLDEAIAIFLRNV